MQDADPDECSPEPHYLIYGCICAIAHRRMYSFPTTVDAFQRLAITGDGIQYGDHDE